MIECIEDFIERHKICSIFLVFLTGMIIYWLYVEGKEWLHNTALEKVAQEKVINEFIADIDRQKEMAQYMFSLRITRFRLDKDFQVLNYENKLRKKYTAGNTLHLLPYTRVSEYKRENTDCCSARVVDYSADCYFQWPEEGEYDYDGRHVCVFFKVRIRYLDELGRVKYSDGGDFPESSSAAVMDLKGNIIDWIVRTPRRDN